jgi:hypothetical protein
MSGSMYGRLQVVKISEVTGAPCATTSAQLQGTCGDLCDSNPALIKAAVKLAIAGVCALLKDSSGQSYRHSQASPGGGFSALQLEGGTC